MFVSYNIVLYFILYVLNNFCPLIQRVIDPIFLLPRITLHTLGLSLQRFRYPTPVRLNATGEG